MMTSVTPPAARPPVPSGPPDAATATRTWKAATEFEAMTINQMVAPMFSTVDTSQDMFSGGAGEEQMRPMLVTEMAKEMQHAGGFGLAEPIYRQMLRMQEGGQ